MTRSLRLLAIALTAGLLGLSGPTPLVSAAEDGGAKWFVLRGQNGFQCWTARVIKVSGEYATGTAMIAGGPFETEEEAKQWLAQLAERATCSES